MPGNVTDYNSWTYSLPPQPTQKDYKQLSTKLKSFVGSSKFLREGSTIDEYDPQTGKRIKRPVHNVTYTQGLHQKGIPAQTYRRMVYDALNANDYDMMANLANYRYYNADTMPTKADLQKIKQQQRQKKTRRVLFNTALLAGGGGLALGILPYVVKIKNNQKIKKQDIVNSAKLAGLGIGAGLTLTGLMESMRTV